MNTGATLDKTDELLVLFKVGSYPLTGRSMIGGRSEGSRVQLEAMNSSSTDGKPSQAHTTWAYIQHQSYSCAYVVLIPYHGWARFPIESLAEPLGSIIV